MKAYIQLALLLSILLISVACAEAITGSIGNGRMLLRANISNSEPGIINRELQVNNVNDFQVYVTLSLTGDLEGRTELSGSNFTLEGGENLSIPFQITLAKQGNYSGRIVVKFSQANDTRQTVSLASVINIMAVSLDGTEASEPAIEQPPVSQPDDTPAAPVAPATNGSANQSAPTAPVSTPNPVIGMLIILAIVALGVAVYMVADKRRR